MESQLELQEIRKAQRELNDAFSFRRSINVDETSDPFEVPETPTPVPEVAAATTAAATTGDTAETTTTKPKKKKRRRVKRKPVEQPVATEQQQPIPDLDMSEAFSKPSEVTMTPTPTDDTTATNTPDAVDWFADNEEIMKNSNNKDSSNKEEIPSSLPSVSDMVAEEEEWLKQDPAVAAAEQSRFQQQLSSSWNQKVMENEEALAPLGMIMERLAILEEEKAAADKRLEDEFRERFQLEEDFYRKKRTMLEEAAAQVQKDAYT